MLVARTNEENENTFIFVPRIYTEDIDVGILNPLKMDTDKISDADKSITFKKGYAHLKLKYKFRSGSRYRIVISEKETKKIVLKTDILCTNQNTQYYEQTKD